MPQIFDKLDAKFYITMKWIQKRRQSAPIDLEGYLNLNEFILSATIPLFLSLSLSSCVRHWHKQWLPILRDVCPHITPHDQIFCSQIIWFNKHVLRTPIDVGSTKFIYNIYVRFVGTKRISIDFRSSFPYRFIWIVACVRSHHMLCSNLKSETDRHSGAKEWGKTTKYALCIGIYNNALIPHTHMVCLLAKYVHSWVHFTCICALYIYFDWAMFSMRW